MITTNRLLPVILACSLLVPCTIECRDGDGPDIWTIILYAAATAIIKEATDTLFSIIKEKAVQGKTSDNSVAIATQATEKHAQLIELYCRDNNSPEGCQKLQEQYFRILLANGKQIKDYTEQHMEKDDTSSLADLTTGSDVANQESLATQDGVTAA